MLDPGDGLVEPVADEKLPNVGESVLTELLRSTDSALARAVRRVSRKAGLQERYSAFGNAP